MGYRGGKTGIRGRGIEPGKGRRRIKGDDGIGRTKECSFNFFSCQAAGSIIFHSVEKWFPEAFPAAGFAWIAFFPARHAFAGALGW